MVMIRIYKHIFPFVLLALALHSCRESDDMSQDGVVTIKIAHWWSDAKPLWDSVITEFEATHPNIRVEQEVMSFNVMKDKVLTQSAAGEHVGDLLPLEDWFAQELIERKFFTDLSGHIARDFDSADYYPIALGSFYNGENLQAWPVALITYPLVYNKAIFDKAGLPYPDTTWTFETFLQIAKQLTQDSDGDGKADQYGFMLDNSGGFDGTIYSLGGAILNENLSKSAFAEPRTVEALKLWTGLVLEHGVAPQNASILGGSSSGGSMRPFETGRFAMGIISPHAISPNTSFPWDITMPPKGSAGRKYLRGSAAFGIPRTSKHPDEAWEFIRWIVKEMPPKYGAQIFPGTVPNSRRIAESTDYLNAQPVYNRQILIEMIRNFSFSIWRTKWLEFRDNGFLPEVDLMVSGEKSVEDGANDADKRINEVLAN